MTFEEGNTMTTTAISSSLLGVSQTSSSSTTSTSSSDSTDQFLTILLAQLKNQDPTNPTSATDLTSQLATLSQVEQSIKTNAYLSMLNDYVSSINNAQASSCIGKTVTVDTSGTTVTSGTADNLSFKLSGAAANATITISDSSGNTVQTITKTNLSSGINSVSWDGTNSSGSMVSDGTYAFTVSATDSSGNTVTASTSFSAAVTGVLYRSGTAYLVTDNGQIPYGDVTSITSS
jgi:flagellar basal-body rod modification protein FlgD